MKKIKIVTDENTDIDYQQILGIFNLEYVNLSVLKNEFRCDCDELSLLIVDCQKKEDTLEMINFFRAVNSELPVMVISDYSKRLKSEDFVKINGEGQVRIFEVSDKNKDRISEVANSLIYPEYASETFQLAIIVPVFNEQGRFENVLNFTKKLNKFLESSFTNSKIYFINDGSLDDTKKLVNDLIAELKKSSDYISDFGFLDLKDLDKNTRKAGTYIEGMKNVKGDIIVIVDGDDSFYVDDISKMINIIRDGYYDIVVGTKDFSAENRKLYRKILSFFKRSLTKPFLPKGVYDAQTGLKAIKSDAVKFILPYLKEKRGLAIDLELLYLCKKLKFRVLQIPVKCIDRDGSHVDIVRDSIRYLQSLFEIYMDNLKVEREEI